MPRRVGGPVDAAHEGSPRPIMPSDRLQMPHRSMPRALLLPALAAFVISWSQTASDLNPRTIVEDATNAVRTGTEAPLRAKWSREASGPEPSRDALLGLATIERLTYEYDAGERHYRQLFVRRGGRADLHDVQARIGLGLALETQGLGGDSVADLYRQALAGARAMNDSVAIGVALLRIGSLLAPLGGTGPGLAYLDSAVGALPQSEPGLRSEARCRRAQYYVALVLPGAADTLAAATAAARQAGHPDAQAFCLRGSMVQHRFDNEPDSATAAQLELIELRRRMRDRSGLSIALMAHADFVRSQARFGESNRLIYQALEEARASKNRYMMATSALGIGGTALMMNDHVLAREKIEEAIASFEATNDSASLMLAMSFRPFVSMAAGDLDGARRQTRALIGYWSRHGDRQHLIALHRQLASVELLAGNDVAAERALDDAMAVARQLGPGINGGVEYDRGRLALRRGDPADAERRFLAYLDRLDSTEHLPRYDGRVKLAEVFARRGELERAEQELFRAGAELDAWRSSLADPELRTLAFQASAFEANDRNVSVAIVLAALSAGGRASAAFELAEHRRARELSERMARTAALRETPGAEPSSRTEATVAPALGTAEIARAIPDDSTAILEFVTAPGGAPSTLFIVRRADAAAGTVTAYRVPPADSLVGGIGRLVALIEGGEDPGSLERELARLVVDSALRALGPGVTRLVIVPDGPLHRLPWDVLRLPDGRYVAQRYTVGIAPSATIAATMWTDTTGRMASDGAQVLAFGDPHFAAAREAEPGEEIYRSALEATGGLPRLPNSAREARLVASYGAGGELRVGGDATAAWLRKAPLAGFDVVHFATHALVDDRVATRSVLALGAEAGESGFLGIADLAALELDGALVVLSACRSARGVIVDGEGVQGLTAPLLQAGARSVVATAWRISDRATVPFVESFYDAMAGGLPVGSALRAARLDAIERGAPPREWAAFTVVGDPFARVALVEPARRPAWLLIVVGLALLISTGLVFARLRARA